MNVGKMVISIKIMGGGGGGGGGRGIRKWEGEGEGEAVAPFLSFIGCFTGVIVKDKKREASRSVGKGGGVTQANDCSSPGS